jgi:hypothetical protein
MSDRFRGLAWDISTCTLTSYDGDGFLSAQAEAYGTGATSADRDVHSPFGFLSRPRDPDADGLGCSVLTADEGNKVHAWILSDPRFTPNLPQVKKGGSVQYGGRPDGPGFDLFDGDDNTKTIYVPYAFSGGVPAHAHLFQIDTKTAGAESVLLVHGLGMGLSMLAGGTNDAVLKNKAGDAFIGVNDVGPIISGNAQLAGSLKVGVSSPPIGPPPVAVVLAPVLMAWVALIETWMAGVVAAGAAASPPIAFPPPPPPPIPSVPSTPITPGTMGIDATTLFAI